MGLIVGAQADAARNLLLSQGFEERTISMSGGSGDSELTVAIPDTTAGSLSQIVKYKVPPTRKAALISGQVFRLIFKDGSAVDHSATTFLVFAARQDPSKTFDGKLAEVPYNNWRGQTLSDQQNSLRFQQQAIFFSAPENFVIFGPQTFFEIWQKDNTASVANTTGYTFAFELYLAPA